MGKGMVLGALFPRTMSNFAKDQNYAAALNQSSNLRNITSAGALTAFSPYASPLAYGGGALGYRSALNGIRSFTAPQIIGNYSIGKAAGLGAVVGVGWDGFLQIYNGATFSNFNYQQNIGRGILGAFTGAYGTGMANAARVAPPSVLKPKTIWDPAAGFIFANMIMFSETGKRVNKSAASK